jgi:segregation and condensation protein B
MPDDAAHGPDTPVTEDAGDDEGATKSPADGTHAPGEAVDAEGRDEVRTGDGHEEPEASTPPEAANDDGDPATKAPEPDVDATVNLSGDDALFEALQERSSESNVSEETGEDAASPGMSEVTRSHLKGLLEALIFASDQPRKASDLAKAASASVKDVKELLVGLKDDYRARGIQLDEVAGGWIFRTSSAYAPFVRDMTKQKPVRLSRAQVETLAILAYRQPVTRPEIDDIRGVDSGPVLKVLLERDLVRILGKKDEPGRPMIYGTTTTFLEFFGLRSLKDLPTLKEFTELTEDSRRVAERELGEVLEQTQTEPTGDEPTAANPADEGGASEGTPHDTLPPDGLPHQEETEEPSAREDETAPADEAAPEGEDERPAADDDERVEDDALGATTEGEALSDE